ncbi:MAG: hypothetical protein AAF226_01790 [Verrucomicrobiota bacterium]
MRGGNHIGQKRGYALIDVVLAITIFSIAVTGMLMLLKKINETSVAYRRDKVIQAQLSVHLTEAKNKPVREIPFENYDQELDVTFATTVEPLELANVDGNGLEDLYRILVTASYTDDWGEQLREAEIYIYQPEER